MQYKRELKYPAWNPVISSDQSTLCTDCAKRCKNIVNTLELHLDCIKPSTWKYTLCLFPTYSSHASRGSWGARTARLTRTSRATRGASLTTRSWTTREAITSRGTRSTRGAWKQNHALLKLSTIMWCKVALCKIHTYYVQEGWCFLILMSQGSSVWFTFGG